MEIYNLKSTYSKINTMDYVSTHNNLIPISLIIINEKIFVEYIHEIDAINFMTEQQELRKEVSQKPQAQVVESKELVEAKNTILNTDPFGDHKHSGQALGEIVASDMAWVEYALENMTNEYIKKRLQLIVDSMR